MGQDLEATSGDHTDQKHVFYRNVKKKEKVKNDLTVEAQKKKHLFLKHAIKTPTQPNLV